MNAAAVIMQTRATDIEKALALCREIVPAGLPIELAIAAHREAVARRLDDRTQAFAIGTVVLAATPALEDSQKQLDCLAAIPADRWPLLPAICGRDREACLAAIRRTIGWHLSE